MGSNQGGWLRGEAASFDRGMLPPSRKHRGSIVGRWSWVGSKSREGRRAFTGGAGSGRGSREDSRLTGAGIGTRRAPVVIVERNSDSRDALAGV